MPRIYQNNSVDLEMVNAMDNLNNAMIQLELQLQFMQVDKKTNAVNGYSLQNKRFEHLQTAQNSLVHVLSFLQSKTNLGACI